MREQALTIAADDGGFNPEPDFTLWLWLQSEAWPPEIQPKVTCFRDHSKRLTEMAVIEGAFGDTWLNEAWNASLMVHDDAVLAALRAVDAELSAPSAPVLKAADEALDAAIAAYRERIASR